MNWKDIKVSDDATHFLHLDKQLFGKKYVEVLKFHSPGFAPVLDNSGAYHIDALGNALNEDRFTRTFGFYCNRATVIDGDSWFHINERGQRTYAENYSWAGNFQENYCTVRDSQNNYFHIDLNGNRCYLENYIYAGDFKEGIACVKLENGNFKHINTNGFFINDKEFKDLGVFHKNYATAKDQNGWYHIDKNGNEIYSKRYLITEPFYNGFALVTFKDDQKSIIDEKGNTLMLL